MAQPKTLFDKIWDSHVVQRDADGTCLLYIDRHLVHEVTSAAGLRRAAPVGPQGAPARRDARRRRPQRADHAGPGEGHRRGRVAHPGRDAGGQRAPSSACHYFPHERRAPGHRAHHRAGAGLHPAGHDHRLRRFSHTATHGAFGALAFGIGTSEVEHVLATQTLLQKPAKNMRITVDGKLRARRRRQGHHPRHHRQDRHRRRHRPCHRIRRRGDPRPVMEGRMTVCNMAIEGGARAGLIAPDETTFDYMKGRPMAPKGEAVGQGGRLLEDAAVRSGRALRQAKSRCAPTRSCRRSPGAPAPRTCCRSPARCPIRPRSSDESRRRSMVRALEYMGLHAGHASCRTSRSTRLHRLLHQRPHRGPARRRRGRQGPARSPTACARWSCRAPAW